MTRTLFESPSAESRMSRGASWLAARDEPHVTLVAATLEAASDVARRVVTRGARAAVFGWQRTTLGILAVTLARPLLAKRGLAPASGLALEAVSARVVHEHRGNLGRLAAIEAFPGLPRALARTLGELRLAGSPAVRDPDLAKLATAFETELGRAGLADRAAILARATEAAAQLPPGSLGALALLDVPLRTTAERDFVAALAAHASATLATVPQGDARSKDLLHVALGGGAAFERAAPSASSGSLERLQRGLFGESDAGAGADPDAHAADAAAARDGEVRVLSAPGESRECVEIARLVVSEAKRGTPFDRVGILLRTAAYGPHVLEALRRAKVPAHFARGARKPDPSGRALLALLACASEDFSARRFAEYLSLGEVPEADASGALPAPLPRGDRIAAPDEESLVAALGAAAAALERDLAPGDGDDGDEEHRDLRDATATSAHDPAPGKPRAPRAPSAPRAPRHWERLLASAAVIGGTDRWERRLGGLHAKLSMDLRAYEAKADEGLADGVRRDLAALDTLRAFALPLVRTLVALPERATWGEWIEAIQSLASQALRRPERVHAVLGELEPMAKVGPIELREVRVVLEQRLSQITVPPTGRRHGKVFVGTIEEARGLAFDVVFVPGLAEKMFPQKVVEDPLLLDRARAETSPELATNKERAAEERLALRLAVGAATHRLILSYPRLDVEQARPRTPSFYGLEVLRVRDGVLRGFEHLAEEAAEGAHARIGWPAPSKPDDAIDEAEFDLALLEAVLSKPEAEVEGAAHYLLNANEHLARALRFRWARWDPKAWRSADGFVQPQPEALAALADHALSARSFSPTALQNFASCPYRFFLSAIHRLAPREDPEPIEVLDPLTRGSLVHEVQFATLVRLGELGMLPVTPPRLEEARRVLEAELARVAAEEKDKLVPAIERVWTDAIAGIAADLREWLRLQTEESAWTPAYFELSFGLKDRRAQDARSTDEPVVLESGLRLRGSIDLVERKDDGHLRATDYKTGKVRAKNNQTVIGGGETLQPVLYALVLEKLFADAKVEGGRLYYCTATGNFERVFIPLDAEARDAANAMAKVVGDALTEGFLPAAPAKDACRFCDFRAVCGPYEDVRTKKKQPKRLAQLTELRKRR